MVDAQPLVEKVFRQPAYICIIAPGKVLILIITLIPESREK